MHSRLMSRRAATAVPIRSPSKYLLVSDDKPSFVTLPDALSFIEKCLSNGDQDVLFGACLEDRESDFMRCCFSRHFGLFCASSRHTGIGQMTTTSF
jgi:hypothetical protein